MKSGEGVRTIKKGIEERNAICVSCEWTCRKIDSNIQARKHTLKTGHTVDIYTETWTRTKIK